MKKKAIFTLSVIISGFTLYTAIFGQFSSIIQRSVFLGMILVLGLFIRPAKENPPKWLRNLDYIAIAGVCASTYYILYNFKSYADRIGILNHWDTFFGLIAILILLELCRRYVGNSLTVVCIVFLAYAFWGNYVPGYFGHAGYSVNRIVSMLYLTTNGIYGSAMAAAATFVAIFVLFGSFLEKSGASQAFIDFT